MPLILVVTKDDRVPDRVRQALGTEGWSVTHVRGVTEAMQEVASEAPDLFLVASELEGADKVLSSFARRQGGPGTIALQADEPGGPTGADAVLPRSFEPARLRDAVERILQTGDRPHGPATGRPKLTSQDIFGDLVAEVESGSEDFPSPPSRVPAPGRGTDDDEIERKLEETLSGVLGRRPRPQRPPPPSRRAPRPRRQDDDVDKLISETLSGLELPGARKRKAESGRPAPPEPPGRPAEGGREEFGIEDFQALVDRPRRPARPSPGAAAPPSSQVPTPGPPPPEPPPPPPPDPSPPDPPPPELPPASDAPPDAPPFRPRFADAMEEVHDEAAVERAQESAAGPEGAAEPGTRFGQYRLLERIGVGGMAEVWKARMTGVEGFQKTVAIKRILPHLTDSSDFLDMFVDEAKLAAQLNHANIIHIYDLGKMGDDYYIAMEYVEGENLRRILERARERGRPIPVGLALYIAARLASALDHAHKKRDFDDQDLGLVHRDVSPQNVLVGYEGTIKLCDFGIVKAVSKSSHTQQGALKGKLQYMSPEQAWGRSVDGRSDIFSVGALLFEMLTGRRLFVGESEMEVLEAVRECRVTPPSELERGVPQEVDALVLEALGREPDERFQSAGELGLRIEDLLGVMRPQPGQGELAAYMAELFDRAPSSAATDASLPSPVAPAGEEATPPPGEAAPGVDGEGGEGEAPAPAADPEGAAHEPAAAVGPEGTGTGPEAVRALEPAGRVEPEEGGRRGLWLLVAAVLAALVVGGVLAWYFVLGPGAVGQGGTAQPPAVVDETVGEGTAEEDVETGTGGDEASEVEVTEGLDGAGQGQVRGQGRVEEPEVPEGAEVEQVLPQDLEQKLAEREEALRRQFETELSARERELQERLTELQESDAGDGAPEAPAPAPPPAEAPATGGEAAAETAAGERAEVPEPDVEEVSAPEEPAPPPVESPASTAPPPPAPTPRPAPAPEPETPPAPPEPAVQEGELVTLGPGVTPPKLVRFEKPEYPPIARRLRAEGVVVVSVLVDETGAVIDTRVVQRAARDVGLEEAALEAARSARYQPATKEGVRVKMWTTLRIPFRL